MGGSAKKERVRAALAGRAVDRVPTSLWGHDFLREWEPRDLAGATLEDYRAHDWDFIKLNPRSTYFAEAWGNTYDRPSQQRQPRLLRPAVQGIEDLAALRAVDPVGGVFAEHLTALRLVLEEVGDEVDVIQTIFSPLGVAGALCGGEAAFREHAAADPAAAHHALSVIGGVLDAYAAASIDAGSAGIFYAPLAWASHDTCTEPFYREFGRPYDLQLLHRVRGAPFNVLHVCRNHNMIGLLLDYPVAALNWADRGVGNPSLADVKARTAKAVMGGIDQTRLTEMTDDAVAEQARSALAVGPERLFLTAGCSIPPATSAANRAVVRRAARAD